MDGYNNNNIRIKRSEGYEENHEIAKEIFSLDELAMDSLSWVSRLYYRIVLKDKLMYSPIYNFECILNLYNSSYESSLSFQKNLKRKFYI